MNERPEKPDSQALDEAFLELRLPKRLERMESVLRHRTRQLTLILDHIHNAHNVSAVIRTADAYGIQDIHSIGPEFDIRRGITMGAERWLSIHRYQEPSAGVAAVKDRGYRVVVLQPEAPQDSPLATSTIPVSELPLEAPIALAFGNERSGVTSEVFDGADLFAHIPMSGFVESFNISVAVAISLCTFHQRALDAGYRFIPLSDKEQEELKSAWLRKDVKRPDVVKRELERRLRTDTP